MRLDLGTYLQQTPVPLGSLGFLPRARIETLKARPTDEYRPFLLGVFNEGPHLENPPRSPRRTLFWGPFCSPQEIYPSTVDLLRQGNTFIGIGHLLRGVQLDSSFWITGLPAGV